MNESTTLRTLMAAALLGLVPLVGGGFAADVRADTGGSETAVAREYRFGVFYNDRRIGEHVYEVASDADATRVRSRADFQVKLLFVTAYRYQHQANELWQDGCLSGLSSVTNDNGTRYQVVARRRQAGAELTSLAPDTEVVDLRGPCPASFAYWDRSRLQQGALLNSQTGDIAAAELIEEGSESIDGETAVRYRLETDDLAPIRLWYRRSDDAWVRLETTRDGATLQYRLEETSRRQASAIEEDARVQDPPGI